MLETSVNEGTEAPWLFFPPVDSYSLISILPSRSTHVFASGRISFFFWLNTMSSEMTALSFLYLWNHSQPCLIKNVYFKKEGRRHTKNAYFNSPTSALSPTSSEQNLKLRLLFITASTRKISFLESLLIEQKLEEKKALR